MFDFGTTDVVLLVVFGAIGLGGIVLLRMFAGGLLFMGGILATAAGVIAVLVILGVNADFNGDPSTSDRIAHALEAAGPDANDAQISDALLQQDVSMGEIKMIVKNYRAALAAGYSYDSIVKNAGNLLPGALLLSAAPTGDTSTATATATETSTQTSPPAETATATATTTPTPGNGGGAANNNLNHGKAPIYDASKFRHPAQFVACQKTFDPVKDALDWILCEPGVLLTNTATFTRGQIDAVYSVDCPEGGFFYASMGEGTILMPDGTGINLTPSGQGINHLVVIRCPLSDGNRDTDLNETLRIGNFVVGHTIWSELPPNHPDGSAYVSMEWFGEQILTSSTTGGSNCGSNGCSNVYVDLYDINSGSFQSFLVTNVVGESGDSDGDGIVDYGSANWSLVSSNR